MSSPPIPFVPFVTYNCGACGYASCRDKATAVFQGLAEAEMCLPYLIDKLEQTVAELATSRRELLEAEEQLIHTEKLASMGQLAAGVAHHPGLTQLLLDRGADPNDDEVPYHVGESYDNATNARRLKSYALFDLRAAYPVNEQFEHGGALRSRS